MKRNLLRRVRLILPLAFALLIFLPACDSSDISSAIDGVVDQVNNQANNIATGNPGGGDSGSGGDSGNNSSNGPEIDHPGFNRFDPATYTGEYADFVLPPMLLPESDGSQVERNESAGRSASIDFTMASKGYVIVSCQAEPKVRFQLVGTRDGTEIIRVNYVLNNQGIPEVFPLTATDTEYTMTVFINVPDSPQGENMYEPYLVKDLSVTLESEFDPFLIPTQAVYYTPDSESVRFGRSLVENCLTDVEVASAIYSWIASHISYDTQFAVNPPPGYIPNPENTIETQKGICYDYASLAAAMLRSNGVPTRLVKGNVSLKDGVVYHAWNDIYLTGVGWITVQIEATPNTWERIDLTFAASGGSSAAQFIGDGQNYAPTEYE